MGVPLREAPAPIPLDYEGDVILEVGDKLFRVSTPLLKSVSPVLDELLTRELNGPYYHYVRVGKTPTIIIEPEYPEAFIIILETLHRYDLCHDVIFHRGGAKLLARVALTSHQYQLNEFMRPFIELWVLHIQPQGMVGHCYEMVALYMVESKRLEQVKNECIALMPHNFDESRWDDDDGELLRVFPTKLRTELKAKITAMLASISKRIAECPANLQRRSAETSEPEMWPCYHCSSSDFDTRPDGTWFCQICLHAAPFPPTCTAALRAEQLQTVLSHWAWPAGDENYWEGKSPVDAWTLVCQAAVEIRYVHTCTSGHECPLVEEFRSLENFCSNCLHGD